jgi:ATP-dependent Lon protease
MPTKRRTRAARSSTCSETTDDGNKPPQKILRRRKNTKEDGTIWVDDDTLSSQPDEEPKITLTIHLISPDEETDSDDSTYVDEDEDEEEFIQYLLDKYVSQKESNVFPAEKKKKGKKEELPITLTKAEQAYYNRQSNAKKKEMLESMKRISSHELSEGDIPHKFRILELPISDYVKSTVIRKIATLAEIQDQCGDGHKLRNWVDAFMRIPFGKTVPLPVTIKDGSTKCTQFMVKARDQMNKHIYGMEAAKLQILQIMAQWIVNPGSVGNVIALQGPMGVGKTSFARNAIAEVLERPFEFFTLGGASDIANYIGHSYTYEGSLWGRIVDSIIHARL